MKRQIKFAAVPNRARHHLDSTTVGSLRAIYNVRMSHAELDIVDYIEQTRAAYSSLGYAEYRWARNEDTPPWAPLTKPLSESRLGLIASGGIYVHGQVAFTHKDDVTHREIPTDIDTDLLRVTHFAFDQTDARRDPNVVFPIEPLRALVAEGFIRELAPTALTFMGGIYSQRRLREELIPILVGRMVDMAVDVVLLVPV